MSSRHFPCISKFPILSVSFGILFGLGVAANQAGAQQTARPTAIHSGIVQDWTAHHLVFSNPGTKQQAIESGEYDRWRKIVNNLRYQQQQAWRTATANGLISSVGPEVRRIPKPRNRITKDWSVDMGPNATTGLSNFPAVFTTGGTSCSDFVVYNTGLSGSLLQASIIGYNNIYESCNDGIPTTYFAFNTGGPITTSVVLSPDGTQIAFVQKSTNGGYTQLGIAKLPPSGTNGEYGSYNSPVTPGSAGAPNQYPTCTAPCMLTLNFAGNHSDTHSSPYYDPANDVIFVGDDSGMLHLFDYVFNELNVSYPMEIATGPYWPKQVTSGAALNSPVFDATANAVFVGDYALTSSCASGSCGYLYAVGFPVSNSPFAKSAQLDYNMGIRDAPLVDSTSGYVYAFAGDDGTTNCSGGPCAGVFQFKTSFGSAASGTEAAVGSGSQFMLSGTFDNTYYTSEGEAATGNLYVVGNTGPADNELYQIPITANMMGTPDAGPVVSYNFGHQEQPGLQVTEFFNTGGMTPTDYIFLSVVGYGAPTACNSSGCVIGYDVTTASVSHISASTSPTGAMPEAGGTSGIVVDNGSAGASNIYFSPLANQTCTTFGINGGCAIQTSQSAP